MDLFETLKTTEVIAAIIGALFLIIFGLTADTIKHIVIEWHKKRNCRNKYKPTVVLKTSK